MRKFATFCNPNAPNHIAVYRGSTLPNYAIQRPGAIKGEDFFITKQNTLPLYPVPILRSAVDNLWISLILITPHGILLDQHTSPMLVPSVILHIESS